MRMSQDLKIYSSSEYVYAIPPFALALWWGNGGREISRPKPLFMVFTNLTHCLNTTAGNNYFFRTQCRWFCLGAILKGSSPVSPLSMMSRKPNGGKPPARKWASPASLYLSIYGLVLTTIRIRVMSRGAVG